MREKSGQVCGSFRRQREKECQPAVWGAILDGGGGEREEGGREGGKMRGRD